MPLEKVLRVHHLGFLGQRTNLMSSFHHPFPAIYHTDSEQPVNKPVAQARTTENNVCIAL